MGDSWLGLASVATVEARSPPHPHDGQGQRLRAPMAWGVVWGLLTAAIPLGVWWLEPANLHALAIPLIAAVYIGFAVADGRGSVLVVESGVAVIFLVIAATAVI